MKRLQNMSRVMKLYKLAFKKFCIKDTTSSFKAVTGGFWC